MNAIEKIISESKTQKEAADKISKLAQKVGYAPLSNEENARPFVKAYKQENSGAMAIAESFLEKQAEYNRNQTLAYLAEHMPLDTIDEAIKSLMEEIAEWSDKVKENPEYYLSWGEGAFKDAAKVKALQTIRYWLDQPQNWDSPEFWSEMEKHITQQTINQASNMPSSTSQTSNLMAARMIEAWADNARGSFSTIGRVGHWFGTKAELGATMKEILAKKINVAELAKAIL